MPEENNHDNASVLNTKWLYSLLPINLQETALLACSGATVYAVMVLDFKTKMITDKSSRIPNERDMSEQTDKSKPAFLYSTVVISCRLKYVQLLGKVSPKFCYLILHWIYWTRTGIIETLLGYLILLRVDYRITGTTGNESVVYLNCLSKTPC